MVSIFLLAKFIPSTVGGPTAGAAGLGGQGCGGWDQDWGGGVEVGIGSGWVVIWVGGWDGDWRGAWGV